MSNNPVSKPTIRRRLISMVYEALLGFAVLFLLSAALGIAGGKPAEGVWVVISRVCTAYYFLYFLVILPLIGLLETPKPLPASISDAVLAKSHPSTAHVPAE
jgi:ubiquinol-cytochrome c reductase cytochrome b subunit